MAAKERKLNIFSVMQRLDMGDKNVHSSTVDADARKELESFVGFVGLRWMSAAEDRPGMEYSLEAISDLVNPGYLHLHRHPELQCKLLAAAGGRRKLRHCWIPGPKKRGTMARSAVLALYPHMKDDEVDLWMELYGNHSVVDAARRAGWQRDDIEKLEDELS